MSSDLLLPVCTQHEFCFLFVADIIESSGDWRSLTLDPFLQERVKSNYRQISSGFGALFGGLRCYILEYFLVDKEFLERNGGFRLVVNRIFSVFGAS